jgi:hypothetical protein
MRQDKTVDYKLSKDKNKNCSTCKHSRVDRESRRLYCVVDYFWIGRWEAVSRKGVCQQWSCMVGKEG